MKLLRQLLAKATLVCLALCLLVSCSLDRPSQASLLARAHAILDSTPLIDGHVDLPFVVRVLNHQPLDAIPRLLDSLPGHLDLPRLRQGRVGGLVNVAYAPCNPEAGFLDPNNSAEDALESIDFIHRMCEALPEHFAVTRTADDVRSAFAQGKISSLIGLEGSHHLMNSLSLLRLFAQLGVRYLTLTHTCHSSFASSSGSGAPIKPVHDGNGLTSFGMKLIYELNRLGVLVDLSHASDETARQAITLSRAPVIFSHSGARAVFDHPRNIPDDILNLVGSQPNRNPGVVMVVFYKAFIGGAGDVAAVADHIEHIASLTGRAHVGIGSDFDGISDPVIGLNDASHFPNLVVELLVRGWSDIEVSGLIGDNFLRVLEAGERVQAEMAAEGATASPATYSLRERHDLPALWGGPGDSYLPEDVRKAVGENRARNTIGIREEL